MTYMIKSTHRWSGMTALILSLGIYILSDALSPTPSHAIPSAGTYTFTSGLTGSFTSNGTMLTDWAFKDPNSSLWLPGIWAPGIGTIFSNDATTFAQSDSLFVFDINITWASLSWVAVAPTASGTPSVITGTLNYVPQQRVPEPSGLILLGLGLGPLILVKYVGRQRHRTELPVV